MKELLDGDLTRVRNVVRFSNCNRIKNESVAEHSYFTAYFSLILGMALVVEEGVCVDMGELLSSAILHDIEECRSGDFVRSFKYTTVDMKRNIEDCATKYMQTAFNPLFSKELSVLREEEPSHSLNYLWKNAKETYSIERDIVAFADFLSMISYVINEINYGNTKICGQLEDMASYVESFYKRNFSKYNEVQHWLQQVKCILIEYNIMTGFENEDKKI